MLLLWLQDTVWYNFIRKFLQFHGLPSIRKSHLPGYSSLLELKTFNFVNLSSACQCFPYPPQLSTQNRVILKSLGMATPLPHYAAKEFETTLDFNFAIPTYSHTLPNLSWPGLLLTMKVHFRYFQLSRPFFPTASLSALIHIRSDCVQLNAHWLHVPTTRSEYI